MSRINESLKRVAEKLLPVQFYLTIAKIIYPIFNKQRRWPKLNIEQLNISLFRINVPNEPPFYFYEYTRLDRYLFPNSFHFILNKMLEKYSYEAAGIAVAEGDIVLEVGANIGEFSRAAAEIASKVICVEPDVKPFECLKLNLAEYSNVHLYNLVSGNFSGDINFYISSTGADSSIIEPDSFERIEVKKSKTLDSILEELSLTKVNFLKIEAEGAEPEVLAGAVKVLTVTEKIAIDCGPERKGASTRDEVYEILKGNSFEIYEKHNMLYGKKIIKFD